MRPFLLLCLSSAALFGQAGEFWFSGGKSLLSSNGIGTTATTGGSKNDLQLGDGFRFAFRGDFNLGNLSGHEFGYAYARTSLNYTTPPTSEQGMAIHTGSYNYLLYGTPAITRIRPFATGGIVFSNFVPPGSSASQGGGSTKFGISYGGGVKMKVKGPWGLRVDLRQNLTPKPFDLPLKSGWLRQTEISAGIGLIL